MKESINQIMKFGVVGFLCFFIDFGILVLLKEIFKLDPLIASPISFTISTIVNYILSVKWVFDVSDKNSKRKNFITFVIFSVIGLGLTQAIMWLGTDIIKIDYRLVKIAATGIVMVFNFVTRKIFLEKKGV